MLNRKEKLDSILLKELAEIINQEIELPVGVLVTVSHIDCAENLDSIKIFISCLPFDLSEKVIVILQHSQQLILEKLNSRIKFRRIPKLFFRIDQTENYVEELNKIVI